MGNMGSSLHYYNCRLLHISPRWIADTAQHGLVLTLLQLSSITYQSKMDCGHGPTWARPYTITTVVYYISVQDGLRTRPNMGSSLHYYNCHLLHISPRWIADTAQHGLVLTLLRLS